MDLSDEHIKSISDFLAKNKTIRSLHLNNNDLKMSGALHIASGLV